MEISNRRIAKTLRDVAAAITIEKSGNIFEIRAYENAADSIEHSTAEIHDLWEEGKLGEVPGLGEKLQKYLDELFTKGKVAHFEAIKRGIPTIFFDLLDIPGIGPKTAERIAKLGVKNIKDLEKQIKSGELVVRKGFSAKVARKIMDGINESTAREKGRMLLPYAFYQVEKNLAYLKKSKDVLNAHSLGSLRRMVATVGDLDFSVSSHEPKKVVDHFCKMPGVKRIVDQGINRTTVILKTGIQADLLVGHPDSYGALLQHSTGSKSHNIKLRTLAIEKGLSLSEYGVRKTSNKLVKTKTEEEFYKLLGMSVPPPELREDTGEIEAALEHKLPKLVELDDIKGDLHLHSNFPIEKPSHAPGVDSIEKIIEKAEELDYEYVGISDHSPSFNLSKEKIIATIEKRTKFIQSIKQSTKSIRVLNGLEIDILGDGKLSVPDEALKTLDYCIAGIHSGHRGSKEIITKRLITVLENPYVDIISHPTNRLLNERDSSEADWDQIFKYAAKNNKLLEINAFPNRLDLRDDLVKVALKYGVKFIINTDAHEVEQMNNMRFGISVARRGWVEAKDVINTWDWTEFKNWFKL
ncbi:MAG: DNA polymerase/3'-5' exonuclease PolX [Candidatus Daviesbacteria bacterium]|nr:DNA polymerase/3'-5' exonuclease PolX [Candidatus Daviesbacteria bacterium]